MALDEAALQMAANGGSIDPETWAAMAPSLLERFEYIVYNEFPMPTAPPVSQRQQQYQPVASNNTAPPESSNKENDVPENPRTPPTSSLSSTEQVPDSQLQSLPPALAQLVTSTHASIQNFFAKKPPHTIQRVAELFLDPKRHYKTLPAYLRAVDRVVSVTSPADVFPFPLAPSAGSQSNGILGTGAYISTEYTTGLGSDESLGGALLTPIPWLTNSSFEGEQVTAVLDQDELAAIDSSSSATLTEGDRGDAAADDFPSTEMSEEEVPHARGPSTLGVEDMGLQDGKGLELSLDEQAQHTDNAANDQSVVSSGETPDITDTDGDIILSDTVSKKNDGVTSPQEGEKSGTDGEGTSA